METTQTFYSADEFANVEPPNFRGLGQHLIVDFFECKETPQTAVQLEQLMLQAAKIIEATVVTSSFHAFEPMGLSGVVVIAESHLAAHTWPEHGTVCVDLFTCSQTMQSVRGVTFLFEALQASSMSVQTLVRADQSK